MQSNLQQWSTHDANVVQPLLLTLLCLLYSLEHNSIIIAIKKPYLNSILLLLLL